MSNRETQHTYRQPEAYRARRNALRKRPEARMRTREQQREWRARNPVRHYGYNIKKKFGMSLADYRSMLDKQGGVCAICKGPPAGRSSKHFCVDHDHRTGRVRGLLCGYCNSGLGHFKDRPAAIKAAARYLEDHMTTTNPRVRAILAQMDRAARGES